MTTRRVLHIDAGREMRGGQWQVLFLLEKLGGILLAREGSPLHHVAGTRGVDVRALTAARLWTLGRQADLVHAHDARAHSLALALILAPKPVVVSRRVAFPVGRSWFSNWKYARAAHFLTVSDYVARILLQAHVPASRITTVYDGVPLPEWESTRRPNWFVAPASNDPRKGSRLAREAAALAEVDLRFSTNLNEDLRHACALLYLTESEGLGSAALLALACGVPVIASRVGGLPEAVADGETGFCVDNRADAVAEAIRTLNRDPVRAAAMGRRGRERVRERFTVDEMARRTAEVYERCIHDH